MVEVKINYSVLVLNSCITCIDNLLEENKNKPLQKSL